MAEFKLFGSTTPSTDPIDKMTQGIGFDLRDVEGAPAVGANVTEVLRTASFSIQEPTGQDTALQIVFGAPQSVQGVELAADGTITFTTGGGYNLWLRVQFGRVGVPGIAVVVLRALIDGVQAGNSAFTSLDDGEDRIPGTFQGAFVVPPGTLLTAEILRDSSGVDAGGLYPLDPVAAGWASAPSAQLIINRDDTFTT